MAAIDIVIAITAVNSVTTLLAEDNIAASVGFHAGGIIGRVAGACVDKVVTTEVSGLGINGAISERFIGDTNLVSVNITFKTAMVTEDQIAVWLSILVIRGIFTQAIPPDDIRISAPEDKVIVAASIDVIHPANGWVGGRHHI